MPFDDPVGPMRCSARRFFPSPSGRTRQKTPRICGAEKVIWVNVSNSSDRTLRCPGLLASLRTEQEATIGALGRTTRSKEATRLEAIAIRIHVVFDFVPKESQKSFRTLQYVGCVDQQRSCFGQTWRTCCFRILEKGLLFATSTQSISRTCLH